VLFLTGSQRQAQPESNLPNGRYGAGRGYETFRGRAVFFSWQPNRRSLFLAPDTLPEP
jgi:hypothetical protein